MKTLYIASIAAPTDKTIGVTAVRNSHADWMRCRNTLSHDVIDAEIMHSIAESYPHGKSHVHKASFGMTVDEWTSAFFDTQCYS